MILIKRILIKKTVYLLCKKQYLSSYRIVPNAEAVAQRCSVKKGVPRNFAKFTGKAPARVSFLIKLQASAKNIFLYRTRSVAASANGNRKHVYSMRAKKAYSIKKN